MPASDPEYPTLWCCLGATSGEGWALAARQALGRARRGRVSGPLSGRKGSTGMKGAGLSCARGAGMIGDTGPREEHECNRRPLGWNFWLGSAPGNSPEMGRPAQFSREQAGLGCQGVGEGTLRTPRRPRAGSVALYRSLRKSVWDWQAGVGPFSWVTSGLRVRPHVTPQALRMRSHQIIVFLKSWATAESMWNQRGFPASAKNLAGHRR